MFDWRLCLCLVLVSIPGVLVTVPGAVKIISRLAKDKLPAGKELPPTWVLVMASVVQSLISVAIPAAIGTVLAPQVGLRAPFFEALVTGDPLWPAIRPQLLPSIVVGISGALIFVAAYYWLFRPRRLLKNPPLREVAYYILWCTNQAPQPIVFGLREIGVFQSSPRLDDETVNRMEDLRNGIGIWGRVLYGGIAEEVLARWGLMSLLVWPGTLLVGHPETVVIWGAIVISGVLFGLGHLPSYLAAGCQKTHLFIAAMISLNLWASLIFGWLFWQHGLLSAMMAHVLFHLVWLPFDQRHYQRNVQASIT